MSQGLSRTDVDQDLLAKFTSEIKAHVPHTRDGKSGTAIINPTPLVDITDSVLDCARTEFDLDFSTRKAKVFGKFDSQIFGSSVKVRPAVQIIEEAIATGKLRTGQTVFEATSGNFGLALGMLEKLGLRVVVLVSRKLQEGVVEELKKKNVKTVDLDVDICPAPGLKVDQNILAAKVTAENLKQELVQIGLDGAVFDSARGEIEGLLARQDVINLAKFLAKAYGGFSPEQYDNELNVKSHETVTGPEIDQQVRVLGYSLDDFRVVTTFGTGGTSAGLSNYTQAKYARKTVHVVFPLGNQDVAGIRTKDKAMGLRFYKPGLYAGQHEVDFEASKRVLRFFAGRGYDIGESSALALYCCIQMLNYEVGDKFVVIIADGIDKYRKTLDSMAEAPRRLEITVQEASAGLANYSGILWTHGMFVPKEEGLKLVASSLGCDESRVKIARASDVQALISTQQIPDTFGALLPRDKGRLLLVCMAGGTSLRVAQILAEKGVEGESLTGGIMALPAPIGKEPADLVQVARE